VRKLSLKEAIEFEQQGDVVRADKAWKRAATIKPFHVKRFIEVSTGQCGQDKEHVIKAGQAWTYGWPPSRPSVLSRLTNMFH